MLKTKDKHLILRVLACFLATFISNGVARFGYVVLIPLLILQGALTQEESFLLGIAILLGYIFGSMLLSYLKSFLSLENIAKLSFLLIALSFLNCALENIPFAIMWIFRFTAGVASSLLIILAAPLCLPYLEDKKRVLASGFVFSGIGFGAVVSGLLLPLIAQKSLTLVWVFLFALSFVLFIFATLTLKSLNPPTHKLQQQEKFKIPLFLWLLFISYVLNAIGYLPHTLFWTDYLVRTLHFSSVTSGYSWVFFGSGAIVGSLFSGLLAHKMGLKNAHIFILTLKAMSCFMAVYFLELFWLNVSVFIIGCTTTGNVALTNALALHIVGKEHFSTSVSFLTFGFGVFQGVFSLLFMYLLPFCGYFWLFVFCGFCLLMSALMLLPLKKC